MIYHLIPQMFACRVNEPQCDLVDFQCPELGLSLRKGVELVARRPYPNKHYLVACRKIGRKAMSGFIVESAERIEEFTTITRWAVGADRVVTHKVIHIVLDTDRDAVSGDMMLWNATCRSLGEWDCRCPKEAMNWSPASAQPRMELVKRSRNGNYADRFNARGEIEERVETFKMHTLERERIDSRSHIVPSLRVPATSSAIRLAGVPIVGETA